MIVPRRLAILGRPFCRLLGHRRVGRVVVGSDFYFGHCRICRRDLVRESRYDRWRLPPADMRIVWMTRSEHRSWLDRRRSRHPDPGVDKAASIAGLREN
jgi:hypothetical protein